MLHQLTVDILILNHLCMWYVFQHVVYHADHDISHLHPFLNYWTTPYMSFTFKPIKIVVFSTRQ